MDESDKISDLAKKIKQDSEMKKKEEEEKEKIQSDMYRDQEEIFEKCFISPVRSVVKKFQSQELDADYHVIRSSIKGNVLNVTFEVNGYLDGLRPTQVHFTLNPPTKVPFQHNIDGLEVAEIAEYVEDILNEHIETCHKQGKIRY